MKGSSPFFYAMKKAIEDRVFSIEVTYSAKDLNEISQWYINTVMPPIYKNYDLSRFYRLNKMMINLKQLNINMSPLALERFMEVINYNYFKISYILYLA